MHLDPMLPVVVAVAFVVLLVGLLLRRFHQPHVVAYLAAGAAVGPHGLQLLDDVETATRLGDMGVVLLLFFVGMEVSLSRLLANWRIAVVGTTIQILLTVGAVLAVGAGLGWPPGLAVLFGFIVSLSSTAVVVSMLREWGQLDSQRGNDALGILLTQDLALVPMLLVLGLFARTEFAPTEVALQVGGAVAILALMSWIFRKGTISLPFARRLSDDHELQVFSAFLLCFGMASLTALAHLSTAIGAFVAGITVAAARETKWVHESLNALRVLLVALFFLSVGMLLDLRVLWADATVLSGLLVAILLLNTFLNAGILRAFGRTWREGLFVGALLAQVGEFSFVLAAVGLQQGMLTAQGYQRAVGLIALSLLLSPAWIALVRRLTGEASPRAAGDA